MTVNHRDTWHRAGPYRNHRHGKTTYGGVDSFRPRYDDHRPTKVAKDKRPNIISQAPRKTVSYADLTEEGPTGRELEEGEVSNSKDALASPASSVSSTPTTDYKRYTSLPSRQLTYLDEIFDGKPFNDRLSPCLWEPRVIEDRRRHYYEHAGDGSAYHFDLRLPHVKAIMRYMHNRYDTVTAYSLDMIEHGQIVFYIEAFPLACGQDDTAPNVFGGKSTAKAMYKHRYGIVVGKLAQHLKVVQMYTFQGRGLAAKSERCRMEYVGLRKDKYDTSPHASPHEKLDVDFSVSRLLDQTSVHLVTDKIQLSNHIMIAGQITKESLTRLRKLIREVEDQGWD